MSIFGWTGAVICPAALLQPEANGLRIIQNRAALSPAAHGYFSVCQNYIATFCYKKTFRSFPIHRIVANSFLFSTKHCNTFLSKVGESLRLHQVVEQISQQRIHFVQPEVQPLEIQKRLEKGMVTVSPPKMYNLILQRQKANTYNLNSQINILSG